MFNGKRKIIDIPATGATINIPAFGPVKFVSIKESQRTAMGAVNAPQAFTYQLPDDGFTQTFLTAPGETLEVGDAAAKSTAHGSILGNAGGFLIGIGATQATVLLKAASASATPTSIEVTQYF